MPKIDIKIKTIILAHSVFWMAQKLVQPFLAIFFLEELRGVSLFEIGTSTLIYFLTAGTVEPIFSYLEERKRGLRDEASFVIGGYLLRGLTFIIFTFSSNVWHLYLFQFVLGIAAAMYSAADKTVFANILGNGKGTGTLLWGADDSVILFSAALGALIGGYLTSIYGIRIFLMVSGVFTIVAGLMYYMVLKRLKKEKIWKGF
ncbi:MAG: MFS transporter [Patescibacteria group bacterium]|nr:MFS transporter [Patescibacteria group bacterium]